MQIAILGAGYVGLTAGAVFAKLGHRVQLVDTDAKKIRLLREGRVPFFEPGLPELVSHMIKIERLIPTLDYAEAANAEIIFICVGTPPKPDGEADLSYVLAAAQQLAPHCQKGTVIAIKSTVPVRTCEQVGKLIREKNPGAKIAMGSCPEFLREGEALYDSLHPDRVVIGAENAAARGALLALHKKLPGKRIITDLRTAELIKYASNAFLATKISFINEIANVCESVGADVKDVATGMGLDPRIGPGFLKAGIGYGGSCFPKDTRALNQIALRHNYDFKLLRAVIEVNQAQREKFLKKITKALGNPKGKRIGILGLAFKANTDDVRESAALEICRELLKRGAKISAYDPKAAHNAARVLPKLKIRTNAEDVAKGADCVCLLTEWPEFTKLPWPRMKRIMKNPLVIDGRNLLDSKKMQQLGFTYIAIGRGR